MAKQTVTVKGVVKNAKPKDVWDTWFDDHRHSLMTGHRTSGTFNGVGSDFTILNGEGSGTIQKLNKPKSFSFTFKTSKMNIPTNVDVQLSSSKEGTEITINHSEVPSTMAKDIEKLWAQDYIAPMNLYFDETTFESHVQPHESSFTQIATNMWIIQTVYKIGLEGRIMRTMTVFKMKNGKLWVHGPASLDPTGMKELESFGEIEAVIVPCPYHRTDSGVWQKKYPNAKFYAPDGHTLKEANKIAKMTGSVESMIESWQGQGVNVLSPAGVKNNVELIYQLDITNEGAALCFCDMCTNFQPNDFVPPPSGAGAYLFGTELGITRASGLPGIGFISSKNKLQQWLFDLCDRLDPRLSTFRGKRLDCISLIHGPPVWAKATVGPKDPVWALRYRIALGPNMPENKGASFRPMAKVDMVKAGFLTKADPEGKSWQRRYCVLTKDARLVYAVDQGGDVKGFVDLLEADVQSTNMADKQFTFMVHYPNEGSRRTFYFHAESHEDMMDWITKLNERALSWQQLKSTIINNVLASASNNNSISNNNNNTTTSTASTSTTTTSNTTTTTTTTNNTNNNNNNSNNNNSSSTGSTTSSVTSRSSFEETSASGSEADEDPMIGQIFGYWFHAVENENTVLTEETREFWFVRNKLVDSLIRNNFKQVWEKAINGQCDHWAKTTRGLVSLVILLDQFSRNMYRDTPKMYAGDKKCLEIVEKAIADGIPQKLPVYQAAWFGFPLTRVEDKSYIAKMQSWYGFMKDRVKGTKDEYFIGRGVQYSVNQADLLNRFGRYPNRNAILGRPNTQEETDYLNSDTKYYST